MAFVKMTAAETIRRQDMKTVCPISREKESTEGLCRCDLPQRRQTGQRGVHHDDDTLEGLGGVLPQFTRPSTKTDVRWWTTQRCAELAAGLGQLEMRLSVNERTMDDDGSVTSD